MAYKLTIVAGILACLFLSSLGTSLAAGRLTNFLDRLNAATTDKSTFGRTRGGRLLYNITLAANLTNASSNKIGKVSLSLYLNNKTGDYDLTYAAAAKITAGDSLTSALVLDSTGAIVFNITNPVKGFHLSRNGNRSATAGRFRNLTTLIVAGGTQTYLEAVNAMIAAPASYTATVLSVSAPAAPAGLASGVFESKVRNGTAPHKGGRWGGRRGRGALAFVDTLMI